MHSCKLRSLEECTNGSNESVGLKLPNWWNLYTLFRKTKHIAGGKLVLHWVTFPPDLFFISSKCVELCSKFLKFGFNYFITTGTPCCVQNASDIFVYQNFTLIVVRFFYILQTCHLDVTCIVPYANLPRLRGWLVHEQKLGKSPFPYEKRQICVGHRL
jgi:hypothetical protein